MRGQTSSYDMGKVQAYQYAKESVGVNHVDFLKLGAEVAEKEYKTAQAREQFVEGWNTAMNSKIFTLR